MIACFSPDGQRLAYNPSDGGGSTWKDYQDGNRAALKIYEPSADTCRDLAAGSANDTYPMWRGDTLYFLSDRTGTLHLFARDLNSGAIEQLTDFHDFDVQTPSLGPDSIVFERAGVLHALDLGTKKVSELVIQLPDDFRPRHPERRRVEERITAFALSPSGNEAVIEAWGELFQISAGKEVGRNLTESPGVREINPAWSPDGRQVAYLSDRSGEYEFYVRPASSGPETRVTQDGEVYRYGPVWSPDGRRLLYADAARRLWMVGLADKKPMRPAATTWRSHRMESCARSAAAFDYGHRTLRVFRTRKRCPRGGAVVRLPFHRTENG